MNKTADFAGEILVFKPFSTCDYKLIFLPGVLHLSDFLLASVFCLFGGLIVRESHKHKNEFTGLAPELKCQESAVSKHI